MIYFSKVTQAALNQMQITSKGQTLLHVNVRTTIRPNVQQNLIQKRKNSSKDQNGQERNLSDENIAVKNIYNVRMQI